MAIGEHAIVSGSYQTPNIVSNTNVRDVSDMLDLWAHKWTPILNRVSWGPDSGGLNIEWISEHLGYGYIEMSGDLASDGTAIAIVSGGTGLSASSDITKQVQAGTLLYAYASGSNTDDMFAVVVTVGSASARAVKISYIAAAGDVISSTVKVYILGHYVNEGSDPFPDVSRRRSVLTNNFTILRQDVKITGSMAATDMYAVDNEPRHQIAMRLLEMQMGRERAMMMAKSQSRTATVAGIAKGIYDFLDDYTSNAWVDNSTTTLTESTFNTLVAEIWDQGGSPNLFCGHMNQIRKFTQWDQARVRTTTDARLAGHYVTRYLTDIGEEIELVPMRKWPLNVAFVLSTDKIKLRAKKGRKLLLEKLAKVGDYERWQMISEFSLEMRGYDKGYHGMFNQLT